MIRAILACDEDWGIGKNGDLPWPHNPADLKWFKQCTAGGVVVMGRTTWESLPRKPLPGRTNIVCSTKDLSYFTGAASVMNITGIVQTLPYLTGGDKWIIGGAQLVESCLTIIDEIWLSRIKGTYNCDTFLPRTLIETTYGLFSSEHEGDVYIDKWRKY